MSSKYKTGDKIHLLELKEVLGKDKHGCYIFRCQCDCGNSCVISVALFGTGKTKSCGCLRRKTNRETKWKGCGEISNYFWHQIVASASKRNITFEISIEDAWSQFQKQGGKCYYTNLQLVFASRTRQKKYSSVHTASLDRKDNRIGYTVDNIQWVHKDVNRMKSILEEEYFVKLCTLISENNKNNTREVG